MTMEVKAKMNFFHDLVGNRTEGEVFQVADNATYSALQKAGYVEKVSAGARGTSEQQNVTNVEAMNPFAKNQQSAEQVGKAQEQANKEAGSAAQAQHEQQMQQAQQAQQQAQQQQQQSQGQESAATEFLAEQAKVQEAEKQNAQKASQQAEKQSGQSAQQQSATNKTTK